MPSQNVNKLSHTIRKVKFLSKNSILTKPQHFPKTTTFSRVFHQKIDNFHGKSKLNFWTKNEDF